MSAGITGSRRRFSPRLLAALAVVVGVAIFAGANAHLVYVAVETQPDCVPHRVGPDGEPTPYRAARPSC